MASKATGYPLAYTAAKIALGHTLPELPNAVTKTTTACFEPSLDYIVTKIPKWDLAKFSTEVNREVGSAMKSVGEVMAIGRTFEESLQKAIRMVDPRWQGFEVVGGLKKLEEAGELERALQRPTDMRLFAIAYAMYNEKYNVQEIHDLTKIDKVCDTPHSLLPCVNGRFPSSGSYTRSKTSLTPPGPLLPSATSRPFLPPSWQLQNDKDSPTPRSHRSSKPRKAKYATSVNHRTRRSLLS